VTVRLDLTAKDNRLEAVVITDQSYSETFSMLIMLISYNAALSKRPGSATGNLTTILY